MPPPKEDLGSPGGILVVTGRDLSGNPTREVRPILEPPPMSTGDRYVAGVFEELAGLVTGPIELVCSLPDLPAALQTLCTSAEARQQVLDELERRYADGSAESNGRLTVAVPLTLAGGAGAVRAATTTIRFTVRLTRAELRALRDAVRGGGRPAEVLGSGRVLPGHTEWVPDPRRAGTAARELEALEATYTRETGMKPDLTRKRPPGETADAGFDPKTGEIFVYDDVPPAFRDGYLAEELHHYQQVRDAGHLGRTLAEIERIDPGFATRMERDVLGRVRGSGFIPYDARHYAPYTEAPRPPGVAGDTTR